MKVQWKLVNIINLKYANDTTFLSENNEDLKLLMKVKAESAKTGLLLNIKRVKAMTSGGLYIFKVDEEFETSLSTSAERKTTKSEVQAGIGHAGARKDSEV